ncbi:MAG: hypothetical protein ACKO3V_05335 [Pirellula sp.]
MLIVPDSLAQSRLLKRHEIVASHAQLLSETVVMIVTKGVARTTTQRYSVKNSSPSSALILTE